MYEVLVTDAILVKTWTLGQYMKYRVPRALCFFSATITAEL